MATRSEISNKNLENCVKFLSDLMERDSGSKVSSHDSNRKSIADRHKKDGPKNVLKKKIKSTALRKRPPAKSTSVLKNHKENIPSVVISQGRPKADDLLSGRSVLAPSVLNPQVESRKISSHSSVSRSTGGFVRHTGKGVHFVPFNQRLRSSTPNMTPTKMSSKACLSSSTCETDSTIGALNSTEQVNTMKPQSPAFTGPKLSEGAVDFLPHPSAVYKARQTPFVKKETLTNNMVGDFSLYSNGTTSIDAVNSNTDCKLMVTETIPREMAGDQYCPPTLHGYYKSGEHGQHHIQTFSDARTTHASEYLNDYIPTRLERDNPTDEVPIIKSAMSFTNNALYSTDIDHMNSEVLFQEREVILEAEKDNELPCFNECDLIDHIPVREHSESTTPRTDCDSRAQVQFTEHCESPCRKSRHSIDNKKSHRRSRTVERDSCGRGRSHKKRSKSQDTGTMTRESRHSDMDEASPEKQISRVKKGLGDMQDLLRQLKTASCKSSVRVRKLVAEMEDVLSLCLPGSGMLNWQTEVDLAMQPLRTENANLRRKVRILTQELKEKGIMLENAEKPDPTVEVIHTQLLNNKLEFELEEEKNSCKKLQHQMELVQSDLTQGLKDKHDMLDVLTAKDQDHLKSQQSWLNEIQKLRGEIASGRDQLSDRDKQLQKASQEKELLNITVNQKDKQLEQQEDVIRCLRQSLSKLVDDLGHSSPFLDVTASNRLSSDLQNINRLLEVNPRDSLVVPVSSPDNRSSLTGRNYSTQSSIAARRSLTFNEHQPGPIRSSTEENKNPLKQPVSDKDEQRGQSHQPISNETSLWSAEKPRNVMCTSTSESTDLDTTEYFVPPGASPLGQKLYRVSKFNTGWDNVETSKPDTPQNSSEPTVKELLGSFADRMRQSLDLSKNISSQDGLSPGGYIPRSELEKVQELSLSTGEISSSRSSSFSQDFQPLNRPTKEAAVSAGKQAESLSRYSVTDYFKKYPQVEMQSLEQIPLESSDQPVLSPNHVSIYQGTPRVENKDMDPAPSSNASFHDLQEEPLENDDSLMRTGLSIQESLYKGTALDTSLSTIATAETASVATADTITTKDSMCTMNTTMSVDEEVFKDGLAKLDAHIAKIQQALQKKI